MNPADRLGQIAEGLRDSDAKSAFTGMAHWPTVMAIADEIEAIAAQVVARPDDATIAELRDVSKLLRRLGYMHQARRLVAFLDTLAPPPPADDDVDWRALLEWNIGQDDPADHYPWTWHAYVHPDAGLGTISTPNGRRPDGSMHTAWSIAHNVWEPLGQLICAVVNRWAHEQFGTPLPPTATPAPGPDTDEGSGR